MLVLRQFMTKQGRRKVEKSGGGASSNVVVGITCPPGWDGVDWSAILLICQKAPPPLAPAVPTALQSKSRVSLYE